jgi:hypothetical protein
LIAPERLSFHAKIAVLSDTLKTEYPESYKELRQSGLFTRLNRIRERRNHLAHGEFDTTPEYIESLMKTGVVGEFRLIYSDHGQIKKEIIQPGDWQDNFGEIYRTIVDLSRTLNAVHEKGPFPRW